MQPRVPIGTAVDHDMRQYQFSRSSGLPLDYYRRRRFWHDGERVAELVLLLLAIGVIVWALLPWGHV